MIIKVLRYTPNDAERWNAFVRSSKNGTFILERGYMEYHADRFVDHSLLFFDGKDTLVALLPATTDGDVLASHGGLTYGGVVASSSMTTPTMLAVFDSLKEYLRQNAPGGLLYKTIPHIYHRLPSEEDLYALFRGDARLWRVDVLSVISMRARGPVQERRRRGAKRAASQHLQLLESTDFSSFWPVLEDNLARAYSKTPTHTCAEISLLHQRFPRNIRLHLCVDLDQILAGVVVYETKTAAHLQYIASTKRGREIGALDLLLGHLIDHQYAHQWFFDFGISNEQDGNVLNQGLIEQKEGFGARAVAQYFYHLTVR